MNMRAFGGIFWLKTTPHNHALLPSKAWRTLKFAEVTHQTRQSALNQAARWGMSARIRFARANMTLNLAVCFADPYTEFWGTWVIPWLLQKHVQPLPWLMISPFPGVWFVPLTWRNCPCSAMDDGSIYILSVSRNDSLQSLPHVFQHQDNRCPY